MQPTKATTRFILLAVSLLLCGAFNTLAGQSIYTKLTNPDEVRKFTKVSNALVCQCGCNLVLSTCPHTDCPFAIPIRRFIEGRIKAGQQADAIIHGVRNGFGESIRTDAHVKAMHAGGRKDLVDGLVHGFGSKVSAHSSPLFPILLVVLFTALMLGLFLLWRRRRASGPEDSPPPAGSPDPTDPASPTDSSLSDALQKLRDRDQ